MTHVTIGARLQDGRTALADLQGASPTGGQVTSESRHRTRLSPGDVIRSGSPWTVVIEAGHNGVLGLTTVATLDEEGVMAVRTMAACETAETRTDVRIDPDTLYQLVGSSCAARYVSTQPAEPGRTDRPDQPVTFWLFGAEITWIPAGDDMPYSDIYSLDALGVSIIVRRRAASTYVHIDTALGNGTPWMPLEVEVDNAGETVHGDTQAR